MGLDHFATSSLKGCTPYKLLSRYSSLYVTCLFYHFINHTMSSLVWFVSAMHISVRWTILRGNRYNLRPILCSSLLVNHLNLSDFIELRSKQISHYYFENYCKMPLLSPPLAEKRKVLAKRKEKGKREKNAVGHNLFPLSSLF